MSKQRAPDSPFQTEQRRSTLADLIERELAELEELETDSGSHLEEKSVEEGHAESSATAAKRAGRQDAQQADNSLDAVETRSHFSDSSSEGEQNAGETENPFEDFDSSVEHNEAVEQEVEQVTEQTTKPNDQPFELATTNPQAFYKGAILPIIGESVYADGTGEIHRGNLQVLTTGQLRLRKSKSSSDIDYRHTYGMPSLFKAEAKDSAASERHRIERDLARQQRDKANDSLDDAKETLVRVRRERNEADDELRWTRSEMQRASSFASGLKGLLKETESELATRKIEADTWKRAFEKQKRFALAEHERLRRKEQGVEDSVEAGVQTESEILEFSGVEMLFEGARAIPDAVRAAMVQTAETGVQADSLLDMPLALPSQIRSRLAEQIFHWLDSLRHQNSSDSANDSLRSVEHVECLLSDSRISLANLVSSIQHDAPNTTTTDVAKQIETCLKSHNIQVPINISYAVRNFKDIEQAIERLIKGNNHLEAEIEQLKAENKTLQASKRDMKKSVHDLVRRYDDLKRTNQDLQKKLDEQHKQSAIPAPISLEQLDQFMAHAREIKAECDELHVTIAEHRREVQDLRETTELLKKQAKEHDANLAASEDERKKLDAEKSKLKEKYVRVREWIQETSTAPATTHVLPSPCTPLPLNTARARQCSAAEVWERKRLAELREPTVRLAVRARKAGSRSEAMKGVFRVDMKLEWQGCENLFWLFLYVFLPALLLTAVNQ